MQKKKTAIITARMTPADKKAITQCAKAVGMTVTDYLTTCALGKEIVRVDGLDDLLSELKTQGRNLNRLTTLANMGRLSVLRGDDLIREYTRLCDTRWARWSGRCADGNLHRYPKQKTGAQLNAERAQLCGTGKENTMG